MLRVLLMLAVLGPADPTWPTDSDPAEEAIAPPIDEPEERAAPAEPTPERTAAAARRGDPNYSRLMFAPTGRPLRQGDGYFSDYELVFPGFAVGLTDNLSLAGGVSTIPGLGMGEQLFYVSPKLGFQLSDKAALSVGGLLAAPNNELDDAALGIGFAVGTFGRPDASASVGLGAARLLGDDYAETHPILMLGGEAQVGRSVALVAEAWFALDRDVKLGQQPFGVAMRFFGERLSADVGFVLVGELLEEGFPLPWVSVSYHFGPGVASRKAVRTASALPMSASARPTTRTGPSPRP
jgi:hypothetical protein